MDYGHEMKLCNQKNVKNSHFPGSHEYCSKLDGRAPGTNGILLNDLRQTDRQTHRQTHRQTENDVRYGEDERARGPRASLDKKRQ